MILSQSKTPKVVLTVAGFDPSSGAGITADLKTIAAHGCYGVSVITALTVQNTRGVFGLERVRPQVVAESIRRLADDFQLSAVKVGMLGTGEIAAAVADILEWLGLGNIVVDPVMLSSSGAELLDASGREILKRRLLPMATVVTPNVDEALWLTGRDVRSLEQMAEAASQIRRFGTEAVVITGGDLERADDVLAFGKLGEAEEILTFQGDKVLSEATHGTGCAFSTAIACQLAEAKSLPEAVRSAKQYVRGAIENAPRLGKGKGPMAHLWSLGPQSRNS